MKVEQTLYPSLTTVLAERIADHHGLAPNDSQFCLYEDIDTEALETFLASTAESATAQFHVHGTAVTVTKTADGELTVDVESASERHDA